MSEASDVCSECKSPPEAYHRENCSQFKGYHYWPWDAKDPPPVPDPPRCITYIACPTTYRAKCRAAQRCIGEDETMG